MKKPNNLAKYKNLYRNPFVAILLLVFLAPVGLYFMWRHTKWSLNRKIAITGVVAALLLLTGVGAYNAPPAITLKDIAANALIKTDSANYTIKGSVSSLQDTVLTIGGKKVSENYGDFSYTFELQEGDNNIDIVATSKKGTVKETIKVHRITQAELAERTRNAKEEIDKKQAEANKQKADADALKFATQTNAISVRTKTSNCIANGGLQDKACTPGAIFTNATKEQVCTSGYSSSVRNVSDSTKSSVYAEYGITSHSSGRYEIDHLISLELGGSNDIANLWPEAANPTPGFHQKDTIENRLHDEVCSGQITLREAQDKIANNWLGLYTDSTASAPSVSSQQVASPTSNSTPMATKAAPSQSPSVYYANCTAARAAGAAPLYAGQPGYRTALDRDGDGIACE